MTSSPFDCLLILVLRKPPTNEHFHSFHSTSAVAYAAFICCQAIDDAETSGITALQQRLPLS